MFDKQIFVRVTEEQKEMFEYLAHRSVSSLSEYFRVLLNEEGENINEEDYRVWQDKRNEKASS
jgi:hypothetical protein